MRFGGSLEGMVLRFFRSFGLAPAQAFTLLSLPQGGPWLP